VLTLMLAALTVTLAAIDKLPLTVIVVV